MLKRTLAVHIALIFLRLLSSVTGDEGLSGSSFPYDSLPFFISTLREMCLGRLDPLSCQYWETFRYKLTDSQSMNSFKTHQLTDNRTSGKNTPEDFSQDEITIGFPVTDGENNIRKRFSVFRRKNPTARGFKRGPGFRSWGGKRDLLLSEQEKKSKFASWGGKRNEEIFPDDLITSDSEDGIEKRPKFQNWGGKRSTNDFPGDDGNTGMSDMEKRAPIWKDRAYYMSEPFKKHVPKRPQFQSWGGKRTPYQWHDFFEFFQSQPKFLPNGGEKRKFSSWGGKRHDELENLYGSSPSQEKATENSKRHAFQNWGGKRMNSNNESPAFATKETESSENPKDRKKREVRSNEEMGEPLFNYNSWGAEAEEGKHRR